MKNTNKKQIKKRNFEDEIPVTVYNDGEVAVQCFLSPIKHTIGVGSIKRVIETGLEQATFDYFLNDPIIAVNHKFLEEMKKEKGAYEQIQKLIDEELKSRNHKRV